MQIRKTHKSVWHLSKAIAAEWIGTIKDGVEYTKLGFVLAIPN